MKPNIKLLVRNNSAIVVALVITTTVTARAAATCSRGHIHPESYAQDPRGPTDLETKDRDLEDSSRGLRLFSERKRNISARPPAVQALAQAQEDFKRLQIVNKSLGQAALQSTELDLKSVSNSVSEIKKLAERLNTNLALPEPENSSEFHKAAALESPKDLQSSILELGKLVRSFVTNPCFKQISVLDTKLAAKARLDLEGIIELSKQLKKSSEKLEKAASRKARQ